MGCRFHRQRQQRCVVDAPLSQSPSATSPSTPSVGCRRLRVIIFVGEIVDDVYIVGIIGVVFIDVGIIDVVIIAVPVICVAIIDVVISIAPSSTFVVSVEACHHRCE